MIYIICALSAEARLFLDYYKLKEYTSLPFKVYENEEVKLIVTGVGMHNALLATTALLAHFTPTKNSILFNIGVAAAPSSFAINSLVVVHKLNYEEKSLYPDILFSHSHAESALTTVDKPQSDTLNSLVDMEGFALFQAASRFLSLHQIAIVKIISDHFEPNSVTKESILHSFLLNKIAIIELIDQIKAIQLQRSPFTQKELLYIEEHKNIFTQSQFQQFFDACHFYHFKNKIELPLDINRDITNKKVRGEYLEYTIKKLTK